MEKISGARKEKIKRHVANVRILDRCWWRGMWFKDGQGKPNKKKFRRLTRP